MTDQKTIAILEREIVALHGEIDQLRAKSDTRRVVIERLISAINATDYGWSAIPADLRAKIRQALED